MFGQIIFLERIMPNKIEIAKIEDEWGIKWTDIIKNGFNELTNRERMEIFNLYCPGCGEKDHPCSCEDS